MSIIKVNNLTKIFGKKDLKVTALDRVSFEIPAGKLVAIVGASGSGKSTLLHLLGGLDKPTSGEVIVAGRDINRLSQKQLALYRRRDVGFVFQFFNLIPVLTVKENIVLPLDLDGKKADKDYMNELVTILGLKDRLLHFPKELSGGQQQRVSIARALIGKPDLILADEPTGNLDRKNSEEILEYFRLFVERYGTTILMVTHDLDLAARADEIIRIEDGRIVGDENV